MNNQETALEIQKAVNSLYFVLTQLSCDKELENEIYPSIYSLERIITQLEQEDEN